MADDFKLFFNNNAKSKDEVEDEVRRLIKSRINTIAKEAAAEAIEESRGERIPPRGEKIPSPEPKRSNISYLSKPQPSSPLSLDDIAPLPSDDLNAWLNNDISEKIQAMRELGQVVYKGSMRRECAEVTIVKQGEFMKDVTDDYGRNAFCNMERPVYGAMSTSQLRTYFSWRTAARRGVWEKADAPYIILYCYELMNMIGTDSATDSFNQLIDVWNNCRVYSPQLDRYMPLWLRDMYAYNDIEGDFSEHEKRFPIQNDEQLDKQSQKLLERDYSGCLSYLMRYSSYNLIGSKFYNTDTAPLLNGALEYALKALDRYFSQYKISLFELICGRMKKDFDWKPFYGAYVDIDRQGGFRPCRISATERYCTKLNGPCHEIFEPAPYRGFIGYILKSVECKLREATGYRASVMPNISMVLDDFKNREKLCAAVGAPEFVNIAANAAAVWAARNGIEPVYDKKYQKKAEQKAVPVVKPIKVEIDVAKLQQIREQSDELTRRLIIDEETSTLEVDEILLMTESIEDDTFEERTCAAAFEVHSQYDFSALPDEWRQLADALDAEALELLCALKSGTSDALCRSRGVLPETAFEQINDISLQYIGDVLIENGELIPDYVEDVKKITDIIDK